jgi:hypothetical protein
VSRIENTEDSRRIPEITFQPVKAQVFGIHGLSLPNFCRPIDGQNIVEMFSRVELAKPVPCAYCPVACRSEILHPPTLRILVKLFWQGKKGYPPTFFLNNSIFRMGLRKVGEDLFTPIAAAQSNFNFR